VPERTDTDLLAELIGIAWENWGEHIGERTITLRSIVRCCGAMSAAGKTVELTD
jgi:hypothetical protein